MTASVAQAAAAALAAATNDQSKTRSRICCDGGFYK